MADTKSQCTEDRPITVASDDEGPCAQVPTRSGLMAGSGEAAGLTLLADSIPAATSSAAKKDKKGKAASNTGRMPPQKLRQNVYRTQSRQFFLNGRIVDHTEICSAPEYTYACVACGTGFVRYCVARRHVMRSHSDDKAPTRWIEKVGNVECLLCPRILSNLDAFRVHAGNAHGAEQVGCRPIRNNTKAPLIRVGDHPGDFVVAFDPALYAPSTRNPNIHPSLIVKDHGPSAAPPATSAFSPASASAATTLTTPVSTVTVAQTLARPAEAVEFHTPFATQPMNATRVPAPIPQVVRPVPSRAPAPIQPLVPTVPPQTTALPITSAPNPGPAQLLPFSGPSQFGVLLPGLNGLNPVFVPLFVGAPIPLPTQKQ